jgi:hypothetical protein
MPQTLRVKPDALIRRLTYERHHLVSGVALDHGGAKRCLVVRQSREVVDVLPPERDHVVLREEVEGIAGLSAVDAPNPNGCRVTRRVGTAQRGGLSASTRPAGQESLTC